nr:MAG TPA: hypothetical protein [Caudoviricetes sp.]
MFDVVTSGDLTIPNVEICCYRAATIHRLRTCVAFFYPRHARRIKPAELFGVSLWNGRVTVLQGDHSGRRLTSKG